MGMDQVRTFVAIELPEEVKTGLGSLQDILKTGNGDFAKWVAPESIHLTLKFLGNVNIEKIDSIIEVIEKTARSAAPFHIIVAGLGAFPNMKRVQTVWVGIGGDLIRLQSLQKELDTGLAKLGFPPEKRPFTPHLTLARVRDYVTPAQRLALGETISRAKNESALTIKVDFFTLMRSQLTRSGAIYTRIRSFELKALS